MRDRYYDTDFEKYLKDQTDQHRLYPSDRVWKNIHKQMHGYRKWPALSVIAACIVSFLIIGTILFKSPQPLKPIIVAETTPSATFERNKSLAYTNDAALNRLTAETIEKAKQSVATQGERQYENYRYNIASLPSNEANTADVHSIAKTELNARSAMIAKTSVTDQMPPSAEHKLNVYSDYSAMQSEREYFDNLYSNNESYKYFFAVNREYSDAEITNEYLNAWLNARVASYSSPLKRFKPKSSKFDFQFYVTPSVSYRRLVDNASGMLSKSYISALPYEANYVVDVNQVIRHRPSVGYEVGANLGYNINNQFTVRSGFQFNVTQYNIEAYVHNTETANITLLSKGNNNIINTTSGFRNNSTDGRIQLKNRYYQVSAPVGIDYHPVNNKLTFGVAATIAPTYIFDKEPFIITSNYKNYADGSQLMRHWNINTSFETYIGYNTGKYRWQLGPQVRYQLLPTMTDNYPIKEFLIDYGFKLSLIKSLR